MKKGLFLFAGIVCMVAYLITLSCSNNGDELRAQGDSREATFVATFGKAAFNGLVFGPGGAVVTIAKEAARGALVGSAVHVVSGGVF